MGINKSKEKYNYVTDPNRQIAYYHAKNIVADHRHPKEVNCPTNLAHNCSVNYPYVCLGGPSQGRCSNNVQAFITDALCSSFCNILTAGPANVPAPVTSVVSSTIGSSGSPFSISPTSQKLVTCPMGVKPSCPEYFPYQCLMGAETGQCSADPNRFESSDQCQSYCRIYGNSDTTPIKTHRVIKIINRCDKNIWVSILSQSHSDTNQTIQLNSDTLAEINVPNNWIGKIWGRTGCVIGSDNLLQCESGDCQGQLLCQKLGNAPVSYAEFVLSDNNKVPDQYRVNLANGINIPISIRPVNGSGAAADPSYGRFNCGTAGCSDFDFNQCPNELLVKGANGSYCLSPCAAIKNHTLVTNPSGLINLNPNLVCCDSNTCNPNAWPLASNHIPYNQIFQSQCPNVSLWNGDTGNTYYCVGADYEVTFC